MASKHDLRQSQAKTQNFKQLGTVTNADLGSIVDKINTELNSPLKLAATFPTANAILNFETSIVSTGDGAKEAVSPLKSQVHNIAASTINFQTQATSGATFVITWPTNTINFFRNAGFTLLGNGSIQVLFSDEAATLGALANPGSLFVKSGTALGYVQLKATSSSAFKTANSTTNIIENADIYRFSTGGSGGSGTGDANSFTENLKHRLTSSYYEFVTPNVFESDEQDLISSATASFDLVDGVYSFDAAENIVSINMFDSDFLANDHDSRQLELHAEWFDSSSMDSNAVYEASLNASAYETFTMERQGLSTKFTGSKLLAIPASSTLYSQATETQTTELNASTLRGLAKKVTVTTKSAFNQLQLKIVKTGSPSGSYSISIVEDSSNSPTGDTLYSKIALNSTLSAGTNTITLSDFRQITPGASYWIVIETDATYQASFSAGVTSIGLRTTTGGTDFVYNGTTWAAGTASLFYSLAGHVYDLRVRITSSASGKKLKAYGIFYDETVGSITEGYQALQKFIFDGDDNIYSFTITNFLPNADHLKVYDIRTGQVYRYGAFAVSGKTVTFPSGTFSVPGETIELIFDQSEGVGYDYSDANNNTIASNHLGSSDATLDKSISGRGILIRNSSGVLKEIWLDASNNLNITDPL